MTYGIRLFNANGQTTFDSTSDRIANAIVYGTITMTIPNSSPFSTTSSSISCPGMTTGNASSIGVIFAGDYPQDAIGLLNVMSVTRATNSFQLTWNAGHGAYAGNSKTFVYIGVEY
tara:strand:- start:2440 stop:2787 length:348 start_codon:yes stop_codon:yes gene_type:complete